MPGGAGVSSVLAAGFGASILPLRACCDSAGLFAFPRSRHAKQPAARATRTRTERGPTCLRFMWLRCAEVSRGRTVIPVFTERKVRHHRDSICDLRFLEERVPIVGRRYEGFFDRARGRPAHQVLRRTRLVVG